MEGNVLLESYIAHDVPVFNVGVIASGEAVEQVGLEAGAAEVGCIADIIVPYAQSEGTRFLPVECAVLEACVPSVVFVQVGGGVLYIFTLDIPVLVAAERNSEVNAQQFIIAGEVLVFMVAFLEFGVVNAQFSNAEVIAGLCIVCILVVNRIGLPSVVL